MPEKHDNDHGEDEIEQLLVGGLTLSSKEQSPDTSLVATSHVEEAHDDTASNQGSDLQGALGVFAEAPQDMAPATVQAEMERLTPFHPEAFYVETPPEKADEVVDAEQASSYIQSSRKVLRWAKSLVLNI